MDHFSFMPHGYCLLWNARLVWLNVITDVLIAAAYYSIPAALFMAASNKRESIPMRPMVLLFGLFILFCGSGHVMDAVSIWQPIYWTKAWWNVGTALTSVVTAILLIPQTIGFIRLPETAGRLRAEAHALEDRQSLLRAVLDSVSDGLVLARQDGGGLEVMNDGARNLAQSSQMDLALLCAESSSRTYPARDVITIEGGRRVERYTRTVPGYGRLYILRDITDADRATQALRELAAVVESTDDAVFTKTPDGRILTWNKGAERTYGYTAAEAVGRNVSMLFPASRTDELRDILARCGKGEALANLETQRLCKDGTVIEISLTVSPITDSRGAVQAISVIGRDITLQKLYLHRLERSLNEKQVLLKEIHHRVKNNLQVISSLLYLQSTYIEEPGAKIKFQESRDRIKAMALVHEKLYEADDLARVNLKDYVVKLVRELMMAWAVDTDAIRLIVEMDRIDLTIRKAITCALILNELISNCLKYAFQDGEHGEIRISGRHLEEDGMVKVTIADNGAGLPPGKVFGDTGTLGFELVKSLAGQLEATVETRNDRGLKFAFTFATGDASQSRANVLSSSASPT
jgi:PAS domain S-box-containing protein